MTGPLPMAGSMPAWGSPDGFSVPARALSIPGPVKRRKNEGRDADGGSPGRGSDAIIFRLIPRPDAVTPGRGPFPVAGPLAGGGPGANGGRLVRYMLLIYGDEHALNAAEREDCYQKSTGLAHQLNAAGKYVAAAPLQPTATATSVRVRGGKRLVTDGPFAETREQLGGYFLIDAKDLDEAIAIAAQIPNASRGTVEVRPVVEIAGLPA
jgi:hypothetical protein